MNETLENHSQHARQAKASLARTSTLHGRQIDSKGFVE